MYINDILKNIKEVTIYNNSNIKLTTFSKDTRTINKGDVYLAIKGDKFDGNNYVLDAIKKGASAIIMDGEVTDDIASYNIPIIKVNDSLKFIQELASYKRSLYNIPVVAITGSVGKTSTKDMIAAVLNTKYKTLKTEGNMNNHLGVPLTILRLEDHEALVVEMGMNHLHEIEVLSKITKPTLAVITNVGTAHIGNLGSRENILKAKLEILSGLDGTLIINGDNDLLNKWNKENTKYPVITYGLKDDNKIYPSNIKYNEDSSVITYNDTEIKVPISGEHFVINAMCAIAVGTKLNIPIADIKKGIETFELSSNRMHLIKKDFLIIDDTYNANFDSVSSALKYLTKLDGRKIAVLGDMLELGTFSKDTHENIGKLINDLDIDLVLTVGENSKYISDQVLTSNYHFNSNQELLKYLKGIIKENDKILVKASNGMKFKEIVDELTKIEL